MLCGSYPPQQVSQFDIPSFILYSTGMIKVIVFDFDGVIVDSTKLKHEAWFSFFPKENQEAHAALQKVNPMLKQESRYTIFRAILREMNAPEHTIEPLVTQYADEYGRRVEDAIVQNGFMPGVEATLPTLAQTYPLYINSGTPERALMRLIDRLGIVKYFKVIYGRSEAGDEGIIHSKEGNFKKIIAKEKTDARDMVLIGDSDIDVRAAESAGCAFIGFSNETNGWGNEQPFPVLRDLRDVIPLLQT
ncbi:MAG: HAD family hydrolase [Candidatus Niyogibacteria bacterium]|nr:HAD family hydrolase [Candidatus Niyogibacteria bacterium]